MQSLIQQVEIIFKNAFASINLNEDLGEIRPCQLEEMGHFQCNGALAGAKIAGLNPRDLAEKIILNISQIPSNSEIIETLSIAGPGFINIKLQKEFLIKLAQEINQNGFSSLNQDKQQQTIFVDYGGPNVAKPMHVGHLRSSIIGDCIQRTYRRLGYNVVTDVHLGDWGTQMGIIICELKRLQPYLPYFDAEYTGPYPTESPVSVDDLSEIYPQASARCKEDAEAKAEALEATNELQSGRPGYIALWKHFVNVSVASQKADFHALGIDFDLWLGESDSHQYAPTVLQILKDKGLLIEDDGAQVVFLEPKESGQPPVILVKKDGSYLYATTEIATIFQRIQAYNPEKIIYVADNRQSMHFKMTFDLCKKADIANSNPNLVFVGFGTVNGNDGKPFKTRAGGVMRLTDLIQTVESAAALKMQEVGVGKDYPSDEKKEIAHTVGLAALKYADLSNNRLSDYIFDLDKFINFEGKTGPYLVYTAVRIKSIFQKIGLDRNTISQYFTNSYSETETNLILQIEKYPEAVINITKDYLPSNLAEYLFELAQKFNRFYQNCHILREEEQAKRESWLALSELTLKTFEDGLSLLGIEIPERM